MKWSGRANKQVVEAVVAAFHDSAEMSAAASVEVHGS